MATKEKEWKILLKMLAADYQVDMDELHRRDTEKQKIEDEMRFEQLLLIKNNLCPRCRDYFGDPPKRQETQVLKIEQPQSVWKRLGGRAPETNKRPRTEKEPQPRSSEKGKQLENVVRPKKLTSARRTEDHHDKLIKDGPSGRPVLFRARGASPKFQQPTEGLEIRAQEGRRPRTVKPVVGEVGRWYRAEHPKFPQRPPRMTASQKRRWQRNNLAKKGEAEVRKVPSPTSARQREGLKDQPEPQNKAEARQTSATVKQKWVLVEKKYSTEGSKTKEHRKAETPVTVQQCKENPLFEDGDTDMDEVDDLSDGSIQFGSIPAGVSVNMAFTLPSYFQAPPNQPQSRDDGDVIELSGPMAEIVIEQEIPKDKPRVLVLKNKRSREEYSDSTEPDLCSNGHLRDRPII